MSAPNSQINSAFSIFFLESGNLPKPISYAPALDDSLSMMLNPFQSSRITFVLTATSSSILTISLPSSLVKMSLPMHMLGFCEFINSSSIGCSPSNICWIDRVELPRWKYFYEWVFGAPTTNTFAWFSLNARLTLYSRSGFSFDKSHPIKMIQSD